MLVYTGFDFSAWTTKPANSGGQGNRREQSVNCSSSDDNAGGTSSDAGSNTVAIAESNCDTESGTEPDTES
jgi:hypothetical protein